MYHRYVVETLRLSSGERLPLLVNRASGLPLSQAAEYTLAFQRGVPVNTSRQTIDTIGMLHSWAENRGIDLDERFGTGNLLNSDETVSLSEALWERRSAAVSGEVANSLGTGAAVVGATQGKRTDDVIAYVRWRVSLVVSSFTVNDMRIANINARLNAVVGQLHTLKGVSVSVPRGQLTDAQCLRLFEIVKPGSSENPFHRNTQLRNFFLLLLYYELGIRKAEALVIKGSHLRIGPKSFITITYTPNDLKDLRSDQPSVKTLSRTLPISRMLAFAADQLLVQRRENILIRDAARRTPFLVLDSRKGSPLTLDALYDIFVVLRRRFPADLPPTFAPHHLRRSWNYRYSEACDDAKIEEALADHIRNYIMGWSKTSVQSGTYNRAWIEKQTFMLLSKMQDGLTGLFS